MRRRARLAVLRVGILAIPAAMLLSCGSSASSPIATGSIATSPTTAPGSFPPSRSPGETVTVPGTSAVATASPDGGVVVTFRVAGTSVYRIRLTHPDDITVAERLLAGEEAPSIPNGRIVRGSPDVNVGYSWHIDPDDVEFADMTMEVCDGLPEYVENGTLTGDRFCPWSAVVISIEPAP